MIDISKVSFDTDLQNSFIGKSESSNSKANKNGKKITNPKKINNKQEGINKNNHKNASKAISKDDDNNAKGNTSNKVTNLTPSR